MKRLLIIITTLGMLIGSGGTASADGEPAREGRTVQLDYEAPWLPYSGNCALSHSTCASIQTQGGEASLTAKVTDAHGQPVVVSVWSGDARYGTFCGETTEPISFDPGAELRFSVGGFLPFGVSPSADCLPGLATTGTIAVTLYGPPPRDAEPREPSLPHPGGSPMPQPSPTTQPETVERSVHLGLRRHLRSQGGVGSDDASCRSDVPVVIQRMSSGDWVEVGSTTTDFDGGFVLKLRDRAGRYRAVVPEISSPERTCVAQVSPTVRHRH